MLAAYGFAVSVFALTRLQLPGMSAILAAHLAIPAVVWLVVHAPPSRVISILRSIYPILLLLGLYSAIDVLNGFGMVRTWDQPLQKLEFAIFGMQPSRDWWRAHPSAFWSSLFHLTYLLYYVIVPTPLLVFLARRRADLVEQYLDRVLATYLTCYVCYLLIPVAGPYYEFAHPAGTFVANLPAHLVYGVLGGGSAFGAAFPSSHIAATVAATVCASRGSRRLAFLLAVPTALLIVGVVYCQMHYAVDSAAGLVVGGVMATVASARHR
jgi:PAP2 superfamily protein